MTAHFVFNITQYMHSSRHVHTKLLANFLLSSFSSSSFLLVLYSDAEKDFFSSIFFLIEWVLVFDEFVICKFHHIMCEPHMVWNNVKVRDIT